MNLEKTKALLRLHEGVRFSPYSDTVGKLTIGVGHNLSDVPLPPAIVESLLDYDLQTVITQLDEHLPWWRGLDEVRQTVLVDMAFNLGITGLLGFKRTLAAIKEHRYEDAGKFMGESKWARQVGRRAFRLMDMMRTGEFPDSMTYDKHTLVQVLWDDAEDPRGGWQDESEAELFGTKETLVKSVGFVVSDTEKYLTIAADHIEDLKQYGRITKITKPQIKLIIPL